MRYFSETWVDRILAPFRWRSRGQQGLPGRDSLERQYWAAVEPILAEHPQSLNRNDAEVFLRPWLQLKAFSRGPLTDGLPWLPFPAINFLDSLLTKSSRVFEFGAGGSSIFFSSRVDELVSVEHDPHWFSETADAVAKQQKRHRIRWHGVLAIPVVPVTPIVLPPTDPLSYTTTDETLSGLSFYEYVTAIDQYPDQYFDVILIDGRARPSCFMHAMRKIKFGGYVILDNAERESYAYVQNAAMNSGFELAEFWGPGPYNDYCWRTIFLRRGLNLTCTY